MNKKFDLYENINGEWERNFVLPPEESEWGTFRQISYDVERRLKSILNDNSGGYLQNMYNLIYNITESTDKLEAKSLLNILKVLDPNKHRDNRESLGYAIGMMDIYLANPLFNIMAEQDPKNTQNVRLTMMYPSITLPDKTYYEDPSYSDYLESFRVHVQNIFTIYSDLTDHELSFLSSSDAGKDVIDIETLIAKSVRSAEEKRNMDSFYVRSPISSFIEAVSLCDIQKSPNWNCNDARQFWQYYFKFVFGDSISLIKEFNPDVVMKIPEDIVIYDIPYFQKLTNILMTQPIEKIIRYLAYHLISGLSMITIRSFDDTYRDFYSIKLNGQKEETKREDKVLRLVDNMLGEFLGKEYVKRYFDQKSKEVVLKMITQIKKQMLDSISSITWLNKDTKKSAIHKLNAMVSKVGYPDKYENREYMISKIKTGLSEYKQGLEKSMTSILILIRVSYFAQDFINKIDTLRNPDRWVMNPQEVNAYYSPQMNEIVFPAGILNAPIFDYNQNPSKNYGGIGTVIAHEITHGFDDQGRKYDYQGNIFNWWTHDDLSSFKARVEKLVNQYSKLEIDIETETGITKMNVNGLLTLGENIADLGGVILAYRALKDEIERSGQTLTLIDKKMFFDSYALVWRKKTSPTKIVSRLLSDPHSPPNYRVWIVRNIDEFLETYEIGPGDLMYLAPKDRVKIY